jgi:transposase-like protein
LEAEMEAAAGAGRGNERRNEWISGGLLWTDVGLASGELELGVPAVSDGGVGATLAEREGAIEEVLVAAAWQRCYVHFLRNALDHLPRKANNDCLMELRRLYDRRNLEEAGRNLSAWLGKWSSRYPKLCDWVEANIEQTLTFPPLPQAHPKRLKSTHLLNASIRS